MGVKSLPLSQVGKPMVACYPPKLGWGNVVGGGMGVGWGLHSSCFAIVAGLSSLPLFGIWVWRFGLAGGRVQCPGAQLSSLCRSLA